MYYEKTRIRRTFYATLATLVYAGCTHISSLLHPVTPPYRPLCVESFAIVSADLDPMTCSHGASIEAVIVSMVRGLDTSDYAIVKCVCPSRNGVDL